MNSIVKRIATESAANAIEIAKAFVTFCALKVSQNAKGNRILKGKDGQALMSAFLNDCLSKGDLLGVLWVSSQVEEGRKTLTIIKEYDDISTWFPSEKGEAEYLERRQAIGEYSFDNADLMALYESIGEAEAVEVESD